MKFFNFSIWLFPNKIHQGNNIWRFNHYIKLQSFFFFSRHSDIYHLIFCFQTTLKFDRKVLLPPKQLHQSQLELHLSLSCFLLMLPTYLCFISCINSYLQISTACFRKLKMLKSLSRSLHVVCVYTEDRLKRWKA